ncbi:MAG: tyrosine-type recombinase/integrase [Spirochaetota bacterium]|nr:tyrosine-type recombinase/integrase [Spirochaetota bacterium]
MSKSPFTIYPRKTNKGVLYYAQFRRSDGTRTPGRPTGCKSKAAAKEWCVNELRREGNLSLMPANSVTLADFAGTDFFGWGSPWALDKRAAGKRLSPRHCLECNELFARHVVPALGDMKLAEITEDTIREYRNTIYARGYSDSLNNKCLHLIKAVLVAAKRAKLIPFVPEIAKAGNRAKRKGCLTLDEERRLFSIEWKDFRVFTANRLSAVTGMRLSEIQGLTVGDIDLKKQVIYVRHVWEKRMKELKEGTKSGAECREVAINLKMCRELEKLIAMNPIAGDPRSFVFFGYNGKFDRPMTNKLFTDGLYDALRRIGIDDEQRRARRVSFHSWRVFYNSYLINSGIPSPKAAAQLGHRTAKMTEEVYYRPDERDDIRERQDRLFADIIEDERGLLQ